MSTDKGADWRPTAARATLAKRAEMLARARQFFADRSVLGVDTPVVVNAAVTDVHLHSAEVAGLGFVHTSPEYAMKRLLAAGYGDIYQICHVLRGAERGRHHNREFTLIEWYRLGYTLEQLMREVAALVHHLTGPAQTPLAVEYLTYQEVFRRHAGFDPLTAELDEIKAAAAAMGETGTAEQARPGNARAMRDEWLDLLMGAVIGPRLGQSKLTFIHQYPASQAALARLDAADPRVACRFELYWKGIELANGFHELADAAEQRQRFTRDNEERQRLGLPTYPLDERLLAALQAGLPDCAGVALGFDRVLMAALGLTHIDQVLPFPAERA